MKSEDTTLFTVDSYKSSADEYIQKTNSLDFFPGLQEWLDKFISILPGEKVLDIGFGSGRDLLYMHKNGLQPEGIELVDHFLEHVSGCIKIPLYKMDMRRLEFEDESYSGIWCCSVFLHIQKEEAIPTLKGFARVLKPGGILYLSVKEGIGHEWLAEGNVSQARRYFAYYTTDEIVEILGKAGFEIVSVAPQVSRRQSHVWINLLGRKRE